MKIINKFISWKKNIEFVQMYELNAFWESSDTIHHIIKNIELISNLINDIHLKNNLTRANLISEPLNISKTLNSKKFWYECEPLIGGSPYQRYISFNSNLKSNHKINRSSLTCLLENKQDNLINYLINNFTTKLYIITHSNTSLQSWDNATNPSQYRYKGKLIIYKDPNSNFDKIDISNRPGRSAFIGNFPFKGGHEYWFGEQAYNVLSKKNILAFSQAQEVNELENNIVHVKLFEMHQYWEEFAQARLAAFRKHLNIDTLEKKFLKSINLTK